MHWNMEEILWAFVLAAHLVLLVVLLGKDRVSRYPWFTAAIALSVVRLIADHLLHGKLTSLAFYWQSYSTMALTAILGLFVLIEIARRVFASGRAGLILKAKGWIGWSLITVVIAASIVWYWGPWPTWQELHSQPAQLPILLLLLTALKGQLFIAILTVEVVLLLQIFGRRFGFGWRTHPQQIGLGLSTNAICFLALQATTEIMQKHAHFTTPQERQQVVIRLNHLFTNLDNARFALWILVLIWWTVWLWREEAPILVAAHPPATELEAQSTEPVLLSNPGGSLPSEHDTTATQPEE